MNCRFSTLLFVFFHRCYHVIFDAPIVTFANGFSCPLGASFETRNEGCEL